MARQNCRQISGRVFIVHFVYQSIDNDFAQATKTRNGESGKGIGEWGMGNEKW